VNSTSVHRRDYVADTIVARATPAGRGGVAVVRISGPDAQRIGRRMLGDMPQPRVASLRTIRNASGDALDVGLALYFPAPASYTGENVLELHGHGGPVVVAAIVEAAISLGARHAEAGEFSRRAFLNGKLDLAQAEAIADLIDSGTRQAARAALRSLAGGFSRDVDALTGELTELRVYVEAAIDFPEEEVDFLSDNDLAERVRRCQTAFARLIDSASAGRLLRDGFSVVIVGRPNAGKSSLMNRLSGEDTAIVTEIAGTTRDILRERIDVDGLAVELVDTAGLREDPDVIEAEGIRRARAALTAADAAIRVRDAAGPDDDTLDLPASLPTIDVRNKIDLTGENAGRSGLVVSLSAKTGQGLPELRAAIRDLAGYRDEGEGAFTARQRHIDALKRAERHFRAGVACLTDSRAGELMAEELRLAQEALGEITGRVSSDDLLGRIFSSFCIGK